MQFNKLRQYQSKMILMNHVSNTEIKKQINIQINGKIQRVVKSESKHQNTGTSGAIYAQGSELTQMLTLGKTFTYVGISI